MLKSTPYQTVTWRLR